MISYYKNIVDDNSFIHSVDMVKVFYQCAYSVDSILASFLKVKDMNLVSDADYWEKLNCTPCAKWSYWMHHLHFGPIYVRVGQFKLDGKDYIFMSCVSIEVNPNKHHDTDLFKAIMDVVNECQEGGYVMQVDYAIDIPCQPDDIVVLRTRKIPGLYKGTRYYGARGQNGFVRIYNKAVESGLEYPLTRVETCVKLKDKFSSIDFGVVDPRTKKSDTKISLSTGLLVEMLQELEMLGSSNIQKYLDKMNYRTRVQVLEALKENIVEYRYNSEILLKLMVDINKLFCVNGAPAPESDILVDEDGFMLLDDDEDGLPFI